jgi:hypothetical protein
MEEQDEAKMYMEDQDHEAKRYRTPPNTDDNIMILTNQMQMAVKNQVQTTVTNQMRERIQMPINNMAMRDLEGDDKSDEEGEADDDGEEGPARKRRYQKHVPQTKCKSGI